MSTPTSLMVRVRWNAASGSFEASTMVVGAGRQTASSTSCPLRAMRVAAGKALAVKEDQVVITYQGHETPQPKAIIVGEWKEWRAFDAAVRGSASQLVLSLNAKGAR